MNSLSPNVPRRALLAGGALVLALALVAGVRATNIAAALGWYQEPACDDLEAQNPGDPSGCRFDAHENQLEGAGGLNACADDQDNDSDERTDCADPDCFSSPACGGGGEWCNVESAQFAGQSGSCGDDDGVNKCQDGLDNDSDGLYDCADPDCAYGQGTWSQVCYISDPTCAEYTCNAGSMGQDEWQCGGNCAAERCGDGQDNDGNGASDCADPTCADQPACQNQNPTEHDYASCTDGWDNDQDGAVDCDDPDCDYNQTGACWWAYTPINPINWFGTPEDCGNGTDDDGNGFVDCADTGACSADYRCGGGQPFYGQNEVAPWGSYDEYYCQNGGDDDGDGYVDCDDSDCAGTAACAARTCATAPTEQDGNGDCEADNPYWGPSCGDGYDNDFDGAVDCADPDCDGDPACPDRGGPGGNMVVNEIQPDGYPVSWMWGNGYCVDGLDNDSNGWIDCWDDACDGQDPVCATFSGLGTEGWPYDWNYPAGDPRQGGNHHAVGQGGSCGDGTCDAARGEDSGNCPVDCPHGDSWCGDGYCNLATGENPTSCPQDCESVDTGGNGGAGDCGNGSCDSGEDCTSCQSDCGTCGGGLGDDYCGNGSCGLSESCHSCSADCGDCPNTALYEICGNGADDDANFLTDCQDPACAYDSSCQPQGCQGPSISYRNLANSVRWGEDNTIVSPLIDSLSQTTHVSYEAIYGFLANMANVGDQFCFQVSGRINF